jgi:hypothetical protein
MSWIWVRPPTLVTFDDLYEVLTAFKAKYGPEGAYP